MRCCREKADVRRVAPIHVGVRDAGEDGEVPAVILKELEIRGRCVVGPGVGRKELIRQQAEVVADGEPPNIPELKSPTEANSSSRFRPTLMAMPPPIDRPAMARFSRPGSAR